MGKNWEQNDSGIHIENSHPGCIWGILHILKYHRWRYIKKSHPNKRSGGSKHAEYGNRGNDTNILKANGIPELNNAGIDSLTVDDKMIQSTPVTKGSVKSRLKALISDELCKRRGRHRRSSTYPVRSQLIRTDSIHHLEPSAEDPLVAIELIDENLTTDCDRNSSITIPENPLLSKSFLDQNSEEECGTVLTGNHLGHRLVDESGVLEENHSLLQGNSDDKWQSLMHEKQLNMDASAYKSKEILDALEMINMNKGFFLKILQDPGSPLAHHFHNQQACDAKLGVKRSMSLPSLGSSDKGGSWSSELDQKQKANGSPAKEGKLQADCQIRKSVEAKSKEYIRSQSMPSIAAEYRADGIRKLNQSVVEFANNSPSSTTPHLKNRSRNQAVIKRFQDLKHKIKHAIKESKHEKHRITMDGILHKIPRGHGFSKDLLKEIVDHWKGHSMSRDGNDSPGSGYESDHSLPSTSKSEPHTVSRTSISESLDKYCQLYESTLNREGKHHPETPKSRTELHSRSASKSMVRNTGDDTTSITCDFGEQDGLVHPSGSEHVSQLDAQGHVRIDIPDNLDNVKIDIPDNLDNETYSAGDQLGTTSMNMEPDVKVDEHRVTRDNASCNEQDIEPSSQSITQSAEASTVSMPESKLEGDTAGSESLPISEVWEELNFYAVVEMDAPVEAASEQSFRRVPHDKLVSLMDQRAEFSMDTPEIPGGEDEKLEFPSTNIGNDIMQLQLNGKEKAEYDYVKDILELSGFSGNELLGKWHSDDQPVDPSILEEVEGCMVLDPECSGNEEGGNCYHLLLFDLINEVLMEIYSKSYAYYPKPLTPLSHICPMPVGHHVLEEVWENISWYLSSRPEADQLLDYIVSRDLAKSDWWMNLKFDSECVGIELEDLIFDDLLEEVICF